MPSRVLRTCRETRGVFAHYTFVRSAARRSLNLSGQISTGPITLNTETQTRCESISDCSACALPCAARKANLPTLYGASH